MRSALLESVCGARARTPGAHTLSRLLCCLEDLGWEDLGWEDPGWEDLGWEDLGWEDLGWEDPGWEDPGWEDLGWEDLGWEDPGWEDLGWEDLGWEEDLRAGVLMDPASVLADPASVLADPVANLDCTRRRALVVGWSSRLLRYALPTSPPGPSWSGSAGSGPPDARDKFELLHLSDALLTPADRSDRDPDPTPRDLTGLDILSPNARATSRTAASSSSDPAAPDPLRWMHITLDAIRPSRLFVHSSSVSSL